MKEPFNWDNYSDQPALLKDRKYKKAMRKKETLSLFKTFLTALIILPFSLVMMPFIKRKSIVSSDFFSIGVDFQREPKLTLKLLNELKLGRVLLRIKLWEMDSLNELKSFIESCKEKKITLKIMQDRENVEDLQLLQNNLRTIFKELDGYD